MHRDLDLMLLNVADEALRELVKRDTPVTIYVHHYGRANRILFGHTSVQPTAIREDYNQLLTLDPETTIWEAIDAIETLRKQIYRNEIPALWGQNA